MLALTAVAALSILGQVLVQRLLSDHQTDSKIINLAGRQRFQSQLIAKTCLRLLGNSVPPDTVRQVQILRTWLQRWEQSHQTLSQGQLSRNNSPEINGMFARIEPHFQAVRTSARRIAVGVGQGRAANQPLADDLAVLLHHEPIFLQQMDAIVAQYEREATEKVVRLSRMEGVLLAVTLLVLVLEALVVFRPAVRRLRETIIALIEAENNALQMNEELTALNQSLHETREELMHATRRQYVRRIEAQRLRTAYVVQGQEEERKRLARDLHDGLGQMLTALKLGIENLGTGAELAPVTARRLADLKQLVSQTIGEVRAISFNLMPVVLNDFGIASALRLLTSQVSKNTGLSVTFSTNMEDRRLSHEVEVALYRIAQESLNNTVKYANAKSVQVALTASRDKLRLVVADDGIGFDMAELRKKRQGNTARHGLSYIVERARLVNAKISVTSAPGRGTTVRVTLLAEEEGKKAAETIGDES
ncbi:MAG: histidine kinase [Cytophagales bacterium]|nr:histidine kinase [Cytophagales bacterium]